MYHSECDTQRDVLVLTLGSQHVFELDVVVEGVNSGINLLDVILFDNSFVAATYYDKLEKCNEE